MTASTSARQIQTDARQSFASLYPFEPSNGGVGVALACAPTASALLVGNGPICMLTNTGNVVGFITLGDANVAPLTSGIPVLPGTQVTISVPQDGSVTHAAGMVATGSTTISVHLGFGN